jgi:hypothetical protein
MLGEELGWYMATVPEALLESEVVDVFGGDLERLG